MRMVSTHRNVAFDTGIIKLRCAIGGSLLPVISYYCPFFNGKYIFYLVVPGYYG